MQHNVAQESAIKSIEGPVMVVSCPGSGKTTTMLRRVHEMILRGIEDSAILVMTFTDAAATEMKTRYVEQYGDCNVLFCTIHSFCYSVLKEFSSVSMYRILQGLEQYDLLTRAMADVQRPPGVTKKDIMNDISGYKNNQGSFHPRSLDEKTFARIYDAYEMEKQISGYIDFDDMLMLCKEKLEDHEDILEELRERYRYIMCDEYQDTNNIQKEILYMLAGENGNIFVVGDDDQSIYGFRGANPSIMMDFELDFPKCKKITMGLNYRSEKEIIEAANELIVYNTVRYPKDFKATKTGEGRVSYEVYRTRQDQIYDIYDIIKKHANRNDYSEIAILTRTNAQLIDIAGMLDDKNIPYHTQEHIPDIYEDFIFGDIIAYLRLIRGIGTPKDFIRILNRPNRGFRENDFADMPDVSKNSVTNCGLKYNFHGEADKAIVMFEEMTSFRSLPFRKQVEMITEHFRYDEFIRVYTSRMNLDQSIVQNKMQFLLDDAASSESLEKWIEKASRHVEEHRAKERNAAKNGITLSTMHRAKGLEWDTVILPDCCAGVIPLANSKLLSEIEEERRLFYVAITRARENLYILSYSEKSNKKGHAGAVKPSPFIQEMKGDLRRANEKAEEAAREFVIKREQSNNGFVEGPPSSFSAGMRVTHKDYGRGIVVRKNIVCVTVQFGSKTKVFKCR